MTETGELLLARVLLCTAGDTGIKCDTFLKDEGDARMICVDCRDGVVDLAGVVVSGVVDVPSRDGVVGRLDVIVVDRNGVVCCIV